MKKLLTSVAMIALIISGAAHAQTAIDTSAPAQRVNEVDQRLQNQQKRIDNGVKDGQINAKQEMHDEKVDAHVSQELSTDQAKHNGHITKAEQRKMNHQLNKNSHRIHHQRKASAVTMAPVSAPAQ